jgi:large subunit ribosomal protein L25
MNLTIECQPRPADSKPNALRRSGKLPAVLYGHKGAESISLTVDAKDAETMLRDASINNTLIEVTIPDLSWNGKALLREVHTHPWRGTPYHISFFAVSEQGSLEVDVPLHFVGVAKGVKISGGSFEPLMSSLHVKCAPTAIPEQIEVDISELDAGETMNVHQLALPDGVAATGDLNRVVAAVAVAVKEEEAAS